MDFPPYEPYHHKIDLFEMPSEWLQPIPELVAINRRRKIRRRVKQLVVVTAVSYIVYTKRFKTTDDQTNPQ